MSATNVERHRASPLGAGHVRPSDAYRDVPILQPPTWGHQVAAYFFFGGISSGAFLLGALADMLGGRRFHALARRAHLVSFATLLPCAPLLVADLGKRSRFHHMLRVFKPTSPMNLGAWTLTLHGVFDGFTALHPLLRQMLWFGPLFDLLPESLMSALGIPSALTLGGYTGVLIGTTANPVWSASQLLGGLFMASSVTTGNAAVALASALADASAADDDVLACVGASAGAVELGLLAGYLATTGAAAAPLTSGTRRCTLPLAVTCTVLGTLLDVAPAAGGHWRTKGVFSAILTLVGGALLRWSIVMAGHESARDREGYLRQSRETGTRSVSTLLLRMALAGVEPPASVGERTERTGAQGPARL